MQEDRQSKIADALFDCLCDSIGTVHAVKELTMNYLTDMTEEEIYHLLRGRGTKYIAVQKVVGRNTPFQRYFQLREIREKED